MLLHVLPVFAVQLECLKEAEMLFLGPTARMVLHWFTGSQIMALPRFLSDGQGAASGVILASVSVLYVRLLRDSQLLL